MVVVSKPEMEEESEPVVVVEGYGLAVVEVGSE